MNFFQTDARVLRSLFNAFDSDGDSVVSFEELAPDQFCDTCDGLWDMFDTDNSGKLNFDEFVYFMNWFGDVFARLIIKVRKQPSFPSPRF